MRRESVGSRTRRESGPSTLDVGLAALFAALVGCDDPPPPPPATPPLGLRRFDEGPAAGSPAAAAEAGALAPPAATADAGALVPPAAAADAGAVAPAVAAADGPCFLWDVRPTDGRPGRVALMGSIHVGKPGLLPLQAPMLTRLGASRRLAVEIDLDVRSAVTSGRVEVGAYGKRMVTVHDVLPPKLRTRLEAALEKAGLPFAFFDYLPPWVVTLQLWSAGSLAEGFRAYDGLDSRVIDRARGVMPVLSLETASEHFGFFSTLGLEEQQLLLVSALEEFERPTSDVERLAAAWRAGDLEGVERLGLEPLRAERRLRGFYRELIVKRNRIMLREIERLFAEETPSFVVVGAAHLPGDEGLLAKLRARGYALEQVRGCDPDARR